MDQLLPVLETPAQLHEELGQLSQHLEIFRNKMFQLTDNAVEGFIVSQEEVLAGVVSEYQQQEAEVTAEFEKTRKKLELVEGRHCEVEELVTQVKVAAKEKDSLLQEREALEVKVKQAKEEVKDAEEQFAAAESSPDAREQLEKVITYYKERLGLQFKRISGGRLQVVMTYIDSQDPERPFLLCVRINDGEYSVCDVEPQVANIDDLLTTLNQTNEFGCFLRQMRRAFKQSLT